MAVRLKYSGHYKSKFFITPKEFNDMLKLFEPKQVVFAITNHDGTRHGMSQVRESYTKFYQYYVSKEPVEFSMFVYSITFNVESQNGGFFIVHDKIRFPHGRQWAKGQLSCLTLSCVKGVQIDLEDERGKYYIYEDIREHKPHIYDFWCEVNAYIKNITKPFRFFALAVDSYQEQKPSAVRISDKALEEIGNGYFFNKYQLQTPHQFKVNNE